MKLNIFLFVAVAGVASFVSWQYVDQFGWTLNHTGVNAGIAASWGGFGDYIGGIMNPIVAGLGLIFFIITLKQNEKALKMSADELKLTREELTESKVAQQKLAKIEEQNHIHSVNLLKLQQLFILKDKYVVEWEEVIAERIIININDGEGRSVEHSSVLCIKSLITAAAHPQNLPFGVRELEQVSAYLETLSKTCMRLNYVLFRLRELGKKLDILLDNTTGYQIQEYIAWLEKVEIDNDGVKLTLLAAAGDQWYLQRSITSYNDQPLRDKPRG